MIMSIINLVKRALGLVGPVCLLLLDERQLERRPGYIILPWHWHKHSQAAIFPKAAGISKAPESLKPLEGYRKQSNRIQLTQS